ncbi:MbnP family protein [Brumimicrobium aurantiacum]|uniref:Copper-binding protein MbnP-like domain-containing protein n=1 Tax=Brumimicrobium aurantiacum TaxID=1737063 RepID=A0A3E1F0X8_9FLAO|nr:MbnP family protein [Brumimicrobium aurantiacum]RFC55482.1 hypothetical protein DXU93_00680 [Brumimicrobium aurantiacum]
MIKTTATFILTSLLFLSFGCNNKQPHEVDPETIDLKSRVNIVPHYQGNDISFNDSYTTQEGYTIRFSKINMIMTNFKNDGKQLFESAVYKFEKDNRLLWEGVGNYSDFDGVNANIGVDSTQNHEDPSARTSDDPLNILNAGDMHWGWNTGYIFIMIEGQADTSALQDGSGMTNFSYHIGRDEYLRSFSLTDLNWSKVNSNLFETNIRIDLYKFFDGEIRNIDIKTERTSHSTPAQSALSQKVIDNFVGAISK